MNRTVGVAALGLCLLLVSNGKAEAQNLGQYRNFALGMTVAGVTDAVGVKATEVRTLHVKPAVLQEFEWRPSHYSRWDPAKENVDQVTFRFFNDRLSQMVIAYSTSRTSGMTRVDMIAALVTAYGEPARPGGAVAGDNDLGPRVSRWLNADASVDLHQGTDAWRLVVTSLTLHPAARLATAQAERQRERDEPARARAQRQQEDADERAREAETRKTNRESFQP
ncbi:MAG: hypothetical protein AB7H96_02245 [Vicinamibacterales bacterium]